MHYFTYLTILKEMEILSWEAINGVPCTLAVHYRGSSKKSEYFIGTFKTAAMIIKTFSDWKNDAEISFLFSRAQLFIRYSLYYLHIIFGKVMVKKKKNEGKKPYLSQEMHSIDFHK